MSDDRTGAPTRIAREPGSDEAPTVADTPPPKSSTAPSGVRTTFGEAGTLSPQLTLLHEEIQRTRVFMRIALLVSVGVAASLPFMAGDHSAKLVLFAGLGAIMLTCGWFSWQIREDTGYTERRAMVAAYVLILGAFSGVHYFGVFSPAAVVVPFGLYFFSLAQSFRATLMTYLTCSGLYALLGVGATTGVLVDRGVVNGDGLPTVDRWLMLVLVETVFFATYVLGRATRKASLQAVEKHDKAARRLAQRDALLREARLELEVALQAGAMGRYTDVVLGSYQLGSVLGRGGMGEVYDATHVDSGQPAAVKVLQRHMLGNVDGVRRFIREAQIVKQLDVPNVVQVVEIGGVDAPTPYIAMEKLEGEDLAEILRRRQRLSLKRALRLAREVGRGLDAAKKAGVVHRDIKPRNLFLAETEGRRVWKVLDFGVSKLMHGNATLTGAELVGTPAYMAPEQVNGRAITHLTDLYAFGVILYRVLTGRPAFTGRALPDMVYKVIHTMPPRPTITTPSLPPGIDDVLAVAMAKDARDRFQSVDELVGALETVEQGRFDSSVRKRAAQLLDEQPWGVDEAPASSPG